MIIDSWTSIFALQWLNVFDNWPHQRVILWEILNNANIFPKQIITGRLTFIVIQAAR